MEWWKGFSQCAPPSIECEVWWDAWSVVVAAVGLGVAMLALWITLIGISVTAWSAWAVYRLGTNANSIAEQGQKRAETDRAISADVLAQERQREEDVILAFVVPELAVISSRLYGIYSPISREDPMTEDEFAESAVIRNFFFERAATLHVPLIEQVLPRLHVISPEVGLRLARIVGSIRSLRSTTERANNEKNAGDADDESERMAIKSSLESAFRAIEIDVRYARDDSDFCISLAYRRIYKFVK